MRRTHRSSQRWHLFVGRVCIDGHSDDGRQMTPPIVIMFAVAAVLGLAGIGLLAALARPRSAAQSYARRMAGIMALAGGVVLAMSAWAMRRWSADG